jgi:hypothetical protein
MNKPHTIEFCKSFKSADIQYGKTLDKGMKIKTGFICNALVIPCTKQVDGHWIEMARIEMEDGQVMFDVPYSVFKFVELNPI